ncbi:MAG: ATP-dependent 6-phosphofructokinase [bacterium]
MGSIKKIGLLTGGGDCPGLNAVIRAVAKTAINDHDIKVIGFEDGFLGTLEGKFQVLDLKAVSGILALGGTILGTSNKSNPFAVMIKKGEGFQVRDESDKVVDLCNKLELDCLICIGGDGTLSMGYKFYLKGLPVIGIPKTIDNDLSSTDVTFGFDSAVSTATDAIDRLHSTAMSHHRVMVVELMGRYAGWLTLISGIAGGGDIILIPEIPYRFGKVCEAVIKRNMEGKRFSLVIVSEGAKPVGGDIVIKRKVKDSPDTIRLGGIGNKLAMDIEKATGLESRATTLGHLQRGGSPTARDRLLATQFGYKAVELAVKKDFGKMVSLQGNNVTAVPIKDAVKQLKLVDPNCELVRMAKSVGTSFGI